MKPISIIGLAITVFCLTGSTSSAHMSFKKELSKQYSDMKVSCNACHVKSKPKSQRNKFGKLFYKELKEEKLTKGFKSRSGADRKEYEKDVMVPAFKKALTKIKKMKPKDSEETYDELIKAGEMPEIKKVKKKS